MSLMLPLLRSIASCSVVVSESMRRESRWNDWFAVTLTSFALLSADWNVLSSCGSRRDRSASIASTFFISPWPWSSSSWIVAGLVPCGCWSIGRTSRGSTATAAGALVGAA